MSESPEVQSMLDKWYRLGKKARRSYGYSFRSFIAAESNGALACEVTEYRTKRAMPAVEVDVSHSTANVVVHMPLPEPIAYNQLNEIPNYNELSQKRLVEVEVSTEQMEPVQPIEWAPVQKKAIERRERLERMRLEALEKRGKTEYKKTAAHYLHALRARAQKKGIDFDLTPDWIESKMAYEFCEATGVRFRGKGNEPFGRTIDRKDSSKGYTKANCWVACWIYNRAKMDNTHEDVMEMVASMSAMMVKSA